MPGRTKQLAIEESGIIDVSKLQRRFQSVIDDPLYLLLTLNAQGFIRFANPSFCNYVAQSPELLNDRLFVDFLSAEERLTAQQALNQLSTFPHEVEVEMCLAGQETVRRLRWMFTALMGADREIESVVLTGWDVHSEIMAQRLISEQDKQLQTVMANLPGMVYRCRYDGAMNHEFVSEGALALTGYSPAELVESRHKAYCEMILPSDRELVQTAITAAVAGHKPYQFKYRIVRKDGEQAWVWEQGRAVYNRRGDVRYLEGIIMDVSGEKRAHDARERLSQAIDQADEGVMITDERGLVLYANSAFCRDASIAREELLGRSMIRLSTPEGNNEMLAHLRQALEDGSRWQGEVHGQRRAAVTVSPVLDSAGEPSHVVVITRDVSKERALEEQLRHSQKLEAVGQLAGGVAHDFNNLLQVIMSYTELVMESEEHSEVTQINLIQVYDAALQARDLVQQLLAFGRRQMLNPVCLNINRLIEKMMLMLPRVLGEHIHLVFSPDQPNLKVMVDAGAMEQVLMNLCLNARDAMPDGGTIEISLAKAWVGQDDLAFNCLQEGTYVVICVKDFGVGMEAGVLDHIFEPFFTTKKIGEGTGLGLATAYGIIKQHKGDIRVCSQPGQGSTFAVWLREESTMDEQPSELKAHNPSLATLGHVLVVEDDPQVRDLVGAVLRRIGIRVDLAVNFCEGIQRAKEHDWSHDLVICDLGLPDGKGSDFLTQVRLNNGKTHLLLMSGYLEEDVMRNLAFEVIHKPFSNRALTKRVKELLEG